MADGDRPIKELFPDTRLGIRIHNLLYREGVKSVAQLRALSDDQLWGMRLMGKSGIDLIHALLDKEDTMADEAKSRHEQLMDSFKRDRVPLDPKNPGFLVLLGEDLGPEQAAMTLNLLHMVPGVIAVTPLVKDLRTMAVNEAYLQLMRERLKAMLAAVGG